MKAQSARKIACLAFLVCLLAPALLRAQGPPGGGPTHPGPGGPGGAPPGAPGSMAPPAPGMRGGHDAAPIRSAPRSTNQLGPAGRWWDDKTVIRAVGITRDQQRRMDTIFDSNKAAIVSSYKSFLKEQSHLDSVNKDPHADQATTFSAIDAVNNARAALQKATAQMLLDIRHQMTQEQVEKLEKLP